MKKNLLLIFLYGNVCIAQVKPDESLKAYYPFNGNANDASGHHNDPVFNNATLTADRFGKPNRAYHFNGVNNYMQFRNSASLNFSKEITLFLWVRPTGFYQDICHASSVISKGGGNYQTGNYAIRFDDALYTNGNGCSDTIADDLHQNFRGTGTVLTPYTPFINKDQWYAVIYTNDGTTAKLYVDCQLKYEIAFKETFTNSEDLFFGKSDDLNYPFWLNADLDDVRIYNRTLTEKEMFTLCNNKPIAKPIAVKPVPEKMIKLKPVMVKPDTVKPVLVKPVIVKPDMVKPDIVKRLEPIKQDPPLEKRNNELVRQIEVDHDSITVTLYDNGIVDGDSVTLIFNDTILTSHLLLTEKPVSFIIKINHGNSRNELVMYAENLGSIPPNTALMIIYDGNKRYELNVSSTKNTNGAVSFKLRE